MTTLAQRLASLAPEQRAKALRGFTAEQLAAITFIWQIWFKPAS